MKAKHVHAFLCLIFISSVSVSVAACRFSDAVFSDLDYGLYWFDSNNDCQKAVPGQGNSYYNKNNKVVIYIHGWQNGSTRNQMRETFDFTRAGGPSNIMSQYWRSRGYNVGVLYWNQFADEGEVKDAEAKIWSQNGPRKMRWRNSDGSYGSEIRLAGHSLGNQVAVALTKKIYDANVNAKLKPTRVALLDPFYSNGGKNYLGGQWTGERARAYVASLKNSGVIFEAYRSSSVTNTFLVGDANRGLLNMVSFVELRPWYFNAFQQREKHISAAWHYFWSMDFTEPAIRRSNDTGQSARTSNSRTRALMNGNRRLWHDRGVYSKTPNGDRFRYRGRL